ncbi:MAG: tRNA pseudouridine(38-40) synthase TruA [Candidatus Gastranaerophilaceae bacterium]
MKRYTVRVEYIGKNYSGSQIQGSQSKNAPVTIQSELEQALSTLIGDAKKIEGINKKKRIKTVFSGRTDKGVNSKGQIVQFETDKTLVASKFIYSTNEILPDDISISDLKEVSAKFHAQKSAKKRYYQYVFYNKKQRSAFDGGLLQVKRDLNISRMQKSLEYLLGEHDFSSFRSSGSSTLNRTCFIYKVGCKKLGDTVVIDITGNRFLYNMVRAIVGTLLLIEKNNFPPEKMKEILEARDRSKAGKTVNPHGLTLMKVEY